MKSGKTGRALMAVSTRTSGADASTRNSRVSELREMNRLKDDVYREMLLLEGHRPGAEMGLALALLRALVQSHSFSTPGDFTEWLTSVCPLGLRLIEASLGDATKCEREET
jgi:hypothetical protein